MLKEHFKEIYHGSVFSQPCRLSVPCPSQHGANLGQHPVTSAPRPHHFNKDKQIRHWSMRLQRITSFYLHWQILNPLSSDIFFQDMQICICIFITFHTWIFYHFSILVWEMLWKSTPWMLMAWWLKEPGHQQRWYWPNSPGYILNCMKENSFFISIYVIHKLLLDTGCWNLSSRT